MNKNMFKINFELDSSFGKGQSIQEYEKVIETSLVFS
tara:strand:+ start:1316 stop:1426 length:111 start_codon:yes stop_codon:yes gene_type:complete